MSALAEWYSVLTPLGVMIGRTFDEKLKSFDPHIKFYDACMVSQAPDVSYIKLDKHTDVILDRITEEEYSKLVDNTEYELDISGYKDEYIPVRPNIDIEKSFIYLLMDNVIGFWPLDKGKDFTTYIDHMMGRSPVKEVSSA